MFEADFGEDYDNFATSMLVRIAIFIINLDMDQSPHRKSIDGGVDQPLYPILPFFSSATSKY